MGLNVDLVQTWAAAIAAVSGGVGIKLIEKFLTRHDSQFDDATQIRDELREELTALREEVDTLRNEGAEWRQKYYDKTEENLKMRSELETMRVELEAHKSKPDDQGDSATTE
jgi:chromosome segregation ATPase